MKQKMLIFGLFSGFLAIGGVARGAGELYFDAQEVAPRPEIGAVAAADGMAWDMVALGIDGIGVKFKAEDVLPSSAVIRWKGGNHYYFQRLDLSEAVAGEWVDRSFSLEGMEEGGWGGGGRSEDDFAEDLRQFQGVEVQVCRRGMGEQRYEVEGFYLVKDGVVIDGNIHTVTFSTDRGETPEPQIVADGGTAAEPDPAPECEGWRFNHWTLAGTEYDFGTPVTEDIELVADWTATHLRVTFDPNGGQMVIGDSTNGWERLGFGETITKTYEIGGFYGELASAALAGHARTGWYTEREGGRLVSVGDEVSADDATTLYAQWTTEQVLTFDAQGGTCREETRICTVGGKYGKLPTPTKDGYAFLGWFTDAENGRELGAGSVVITWPARTIYAHWTDKQTVTFDAHGGTCKPATMEVTIGGKYGKLPTPKWAGHVFLGWYTDAENGRKLGAGSVVTRKATRTMHAYWTDEQVVTFDAHGGTCEPATKTYKMGGKYGALPVPTWEGHTFMGWYTDAENGRKLGAVSIVTEKTERTMHAYWATEQVVTFDAHGGTCNPATKTYKIGDKYGKLPVPEWEGHTFLGWYTDAENGRKLGPGSIVTAKEERTMHAYWDEAAAGGLSISGFSMKNAGGPAARNGRGTSGAVLTFETKAGSVYEIQWTSELGGEWTVLKSWTAEEDGETAVTVGVPAGERTGFFRIGAREADGTLTSEPHEALWEDEKERASARGEE